MSSYDFTCIQPGENAAAVSILGLQCGGSVAINGSTELSDIIRFNDGGCVYGISLEPGATLSAYDYKLHVDAQGPGGMMSGSGYLYFMDATGDTYSLEIFSSKRKDHTLSYNSRNPKIIAIVWSNKKK